MGLVSRCIATALVAVALAGCSGNDDAPKAAEASSASPAAEARTLAETCPMLEAIKTPNDFASAVKLRAYVNEVEALAAEGDTETKNALQFVIDAYNKEAAADPGTEAAEAFDAVTRAFQLMADRCGAAGSSAFQG